jgi:hypothetical protein
MAHTFEELKKKKVADLKEIAEGLEHDALKGYSSMRKDDLVEALCTALGIEGQGEAQPGELDKRGIKLKIQELKAKRMAALEAHDPLQLKRVRRRIHRLKRKLRASSV